METTIDGHGVDLKNDLKRDLKNDLEMTLETDFRWGTARGGPPGVKWKTVLLVGVLPASYGRLSFLVGVLPVSCGRRSMYK